MPLLNSGIQIVLFYVEIFKTCFDEVIPSVKDWQGMCLTWSVEWKPVHCPARWDTRLSTSRHWNLIENMLDEWTSTVDSTLHCDWSSTVDKFQTNLDQLSRFEISSRSTLDFRKFRATNCRDSGKARD